MRGTINLSGVDTANKTLSNLGTTAVNADIIMGSNDVTGIGSLIFTNGGSGGAAGGSWIVSDASGDIQINVADADSLILSYENSLVWTINKSRQLGNAIILSDSLTLNDASAEPAVAGEIMNDGADVKIFTGGAVKNITNMVVNPIAADFKPAASLTYNLGSSTEVWAALFVTNVRFNASTQFINGAAVGMTFEVPTGDVFDWQINNASEMIIRAGEVDIQNNDLVDIGELTFNGGSNQFISTSGGMLFNVDAGNILEFDVALTGYFFVTSTQDVFGTYAVFWNKTNANRGTPASAGSTIFNTDDGFINVWDGSQWTDAVGNAT